MSVGCGLGFRLVCIFGIRIFCLLFWFRLGGFRIMVPLSQSLQLLFTCCNVKQEQVGRERQSASGIKGWEEQIRRE